MSEGTGQEQWRGYDFTISENESTILLFGVGRDYEFIDEEKESGGSGVMRSMPLLNGIKNICGNILTDIK